MIFRFNFLSAAWPQLSLWFTSQRKRLGANRIGGKRKFPLRVLVLTACLLLAALGAVRLKTLTRQSMPLLESDQFVQQYLNNTYALFDLGVADINGDHWIDIFSTNHNARQLFLINQAGKTFEDKATEFKFPQNYEALEGHVPAVTVNHDPGFHAYWDNYTLIIRLLEPSQIDHFNELGLSGKIIIPESAQAQAQNSIEIAERDDAQMGKILTFKARDAGEIQIKFPASEPFSRPQFLIDRWIALNQIFLGSEETHPTSHEFVLPPINALPHMDRHAIAWNDIDGNGQPDALIVRGGMNGRLKEISPNTQDELLLQYPSGFEDHSLDLNLDKNGCAARKIVWVDFNHDNLLDAHIACGRNLPLGALQAHQLQQQYPDGSFRDVAASVNLNLVGDGQFLWLDFDNDNDSDLFQVDDIAVRLWKNEANNFIPVILHNNYGLKVRQLTLGDYDNDGYFDVFMALRKGSLLFHNQGNTFEAINPETIGLPNRTLSANWVDYDNDGFLDLHTLPDGVFRQQATNHHFEPTNLLAINDKKSFGGYAFTTWFDVDNDGTRDLLLGKHLDISWWEKFRHQFADFQDVFQLSRAVKSEVLLYRNKSSTHHWLQVQLDAGPGNHVAAGAKVQLTLADGSIQTQAVSQSEGSLRSQGHYRLYFGLGENSEIKSFKVIWSDGRQETVPPPAVDQLVFVRKRHPLVAS